MASKTSAILLNSSEKKSEIIALRRSKHTFQEIADKADCTTGYAHRIVTAHLDQVNALRVNETDLMVTEMQSDLETLIRGHWPQRNDTDHANLILKAMAQLAKLRGLNAADKIELTNTLPATLEYIVDTASTTRAPGTPDAKPSSDPPA